MQFSLWKGDEGCMEQKVEIYGVHCLEKVFLDTPPREEARTSRVSGLRNEKLSFQAAFTAKENQLYRIRVESPLTATVRQVVSVPCAYPAHPETDEGYLRISPGLYPDLLRELPEGLVRGIPGQWNSLWVELIPGEEGFLPGTYPVILSWEEEQTGEIVGRIQVQAEILDAFLPDQQLIRTDWFHADCLATYYQVPVFSQRHWELVERFVKAGVDRGMNMLLTPQFTPPLDTRKGGERPTVQLVEVWLEDGSYRFGFDRLKQWIDMGRRCGIQYFEMSHLFTQWGAQAAPKIIAHTAQGDQRIFGWDTPAVGGEYTRFLHAYLPKLTQKLREWGLEGQVYFHISDEPNLTQLESYRAAKDSVAELLEGFPVIDALSDYDFYRTGAVEHPICANDHIHRFLENGVSGVWSYYCTSQKLRVSNRFFSMPWSRCRVYGVQLFRYQTPGILHWGYNFYYSQYSIYPIDPYLTTDAGGSFPGGDPFLVYPGQDGRPEESVRMVVMEQALFDLRALEALAKKIGRERAVEFVEQELGQPVTFETSFITGEQLLSLREKVNRMLAQPDENCRG